MRLELIDPKTGEERYWPVESREALVAVFETVPEALEWCRKDADNRDALLDVASVVKGGGPGLAEALGRVFDEGERGDIGAEVIAEEEHGFFTIRRVARRDIGPEVFAEAVRQVLDKGAGAGEELVERWRMAREAEATERRREAEELQKLAADVVGRIGGWLKTVLG